MNGNSRHYAYRAPNHRKSSIDCDATRADTRSERRGREEGARVGGAMGGTAGPRGRRRALVGLMAVAALVLAGCVGLKEGPPLPGGGGDLPNVCVPVGPPANPAPAAQSAPDPGGGACLPICLPGQSPPQPSTGPGQPDVPPCVPLCPIDTGGGPQPPAPAARAPAPGCLEIPIPCLPGQGAPPTAIARAVQNCVNFCLPGQQPQPPEAIDVPVPRQCVPLCIFARIIHGLPGLDPCPTPLPRD
jgi:hypothetical protein